MTVITLGIRSDYSGNPWEAEAKERREREERESSKKAPKSTKVNGANVFGGKSVSSTKPTKLNFFTNAVRVAHPGGKITSNKAEATLKFLRRKQQKGIELTAEEVEIVAKFTIGNPKEKVGVAASHVLGSTPTSVIPDDHLLARLEEKSEEEVRQRKEKARRGAIAVGGGAVKDCRDLKANNRNQSTDGDKFAKLGKNKAGKKAKSGKFQLAKKAKPYTAKSKQSHGRDMSLEERILGGLTSGR